MFEIVATTHFERELRKIVAKHREVVLMYERALEILEKDPYNLTRKNKIKKLTDIAKDTDGMWRLTNGVYRIQYDIEGKTVVLIRISDRKDIYRK